MGSKPTDIQGLIDQAKREGYDDQRESEKQFKALTEEAARLQKHLQEIQTAFQDAKSAYDQRYSARLAKIEAWEAQLERNPSE